MKLLTYISRVVRSIKSHLLMRNLNSNSFVDEEWYLKNYPDVAAAGVNPKVHYEIYGRKEGRLPFYLPSIPLERNLWANAFTPEKVLAELCTFVDDNDANSIYTRKVLAEFFLFQGKYEQSLSYARKAIAEIDQVAGLINESSLFLTAFEAAYRLGSKSVAAQLLSHHRWKESNAKLLACQMLSLKKSLPYLNRIYLKHRLLEINSANSENYLDNLYAKHARWLWSNAFYSKRYKPAHKVSVVVPLYNAEDTISNALKSLLSQTWPEIEIIVVDDCSTDTSLEVVSTFTKYPNVKVLTNSENMGAYPTRNRGAKQASGDFITVMDADDWAHPQKIELQVLPLISDQGFVGTVSHWVRCNESLEFTRLRNDGSWIYRNISSLMIPSKIFKTVGYWDELKAGADTEFYLRLLANFGENSIHEVLQDVPLSFGRVHSASLTQTSKTHLVTQFGGVRQEHLGYAKCWHKNSPLPIKLENQACHFPVPPELCSNALSRGLSEQEIHRWRRALDNSWYLERYSDVSKMGVTLYDHFWSSGEALDYAPSPLFVPSAYRYKKKLCSTVSPTWDALINGWNFSEPVVCDGASDTDGAHILIVAHSVSQELFGAELSFEDIVNAAHASGYKVTLVLPNAANTDYVTRLLKKSNRIIFLPLQWFTSSKAASSEIERFMTSYIQSNAVSLVYINTIMMNEPYRAANNVNVPVITHVRELPEHDNHIRGLLQETAKQTAERLKRWTDYFVANSHFTAEWLGLKDRVFVLSNQVEQPERVAPIDLAAPLKVCLIGSNIQKKGVEDFFCIAQACKATDIQFSLYGPVTHDVKCAEKKYPTKNIVYEGYTQNIQEAIQANDIVLSLSWFQESFGRTAAEAMSNGRVVLGYDYGAILETVSEHGGMFFPFKRPDLVADALKVIAKNKVMLLPLAKHALQKARLEYSQEIYHTKFKRIVDEILTSHSTK